MSFLKASHLSRRQCLGCTTATAGASWLVATGIESIAWGADAAAQSARGITRGAPQIFVDLDGVESSENVHHEFHAATKHSDNPVLFGEFEWERKMGGPCGSFVYDADETLFKVCTRTLPGTVTVSLMPADLTR